MGKEMIWSWYNGGVYRHVFPRN